MAQLYLCVLLVGSLFVDNIVAAPTEVNGSSKLVSQEECPSDKPEINCEEDPCSVTPYGYCPLYPTAVCRPYKCGWCSARWYNELNERVYCYAF